MVPLLLAVLVPAVRVFRGDSVGEGAVGPQPISRLLSTFDKDAVEAGWGGAGPGLADLHKLLAILA